MIKKYSLFDWDQNGFKGKYGMVMGLEYKENEMKTEL